MLIHAVRRGIYPSCSAESKLCRYLFPSPTRGTIQGRVKDAITGDKIPGATVKVEQPAGPSATTNKGGKYTLNGAPEGLQDITASATGCTSQTALQVEVVANDTVKQDFELVC